VRVAGYDVFRESMQVRQRIGYLPENVPLYLDMRVAPYLDFVAEVKGVPRAQRKAKVADAMDRCQIADRRNWLIKNLSKGYRQRVGLAQAIINDPPVLILDEPTIGLDPKQITDIRALIKSFGGANQTVILSTHILPEVAMVCSSVVIINKGSIVAQGPIDSLVEQFFPTSRVHVEIEGPRDPIRERLAAIPGVADVRDVLGSDGTAFLVESARGRDVRSEVFQLAAQQKWELRELRRVGMTLEEVFMRVVAGEDTEPAAPEAAPARAADEVPA
jgi:ABC-2 type transport system ATP-binding protein